MPIRHFSKAFTKLQSKIKNVQARLRQNPRNENDRDIPLPQEEKVERMVVEISLWSAAKIIFLIAGFFLAFSFLGRITSILIMLFFSAFLAVTLNPGVDRLEKWGIRRGVGVVILLILVFSVFFGILGGVIPIMGGELIKIWESALSLVSSLSQKDFSGLPGWMQQPLQDTFVLIEEYVKNVSAEKWQADITNVLRGSLDNLGTAVGKGFSFVLTFFGGILQGVLVIILTFFLVVGKRSISEFFVHLFPKKYEEYFLGKAAAVQKKVTEWVHGQITLFFIVGTIAYVGLSLIGVQYALTLALIAGLAEFIPYVGPVIAFASAAPVAFNNSFSVGLITMAFYALLQFAEGNFIVPMVMKKAVGISPIVTIVSMLIGWEFLGIMGMILAVPIASVLSLFVYDFSSREKRTFQKRPVEPQKNEKHKQKKKGL